MPMPRAIPDMIGDAFHSFGSFLDRTKPLPKNHVSAAIVVDTFVQYIPKRHVGHTATACRLCLWRISMILLGVIGVASDQSNILVSNTGSKAQDPPRPISAISRWRHFSAGGELGKLCWRRLRWVLPCGDARRFTSIGNSSFPSALNYRCNACMAAQSPEPPPPPPTHTHTHPHASLPSFCST